MGLKCLYSHIRIKIDTMISYHEEAGKIINEALKKLTDEELSFLIKFIEADLAEFKLIEEDSTKNTRM